MILRLMICLALLFSTASCIGVGHSFYNRGVSPEASTEQIDDPVLDAEWFELSGKKLVPLARRGTTRFMFEGIDVHVRPHNDQPTATFVGFIVPVVPIPPKAVGSVTGIDYKLEPPFVVSLSLDPAGARLLFDTRKPFIKVGNGEEVVSKDVLLFPCNEPKKYSPLKDPVIVGTEKICLHLLFDMVPPHPTTTYLFNLQGMTKEGTPLKGLTIEFREASSWDAGSTAQ